MWSTWAFVFVIGLLISIFLHELGHFITARWTGMKATQFFLFMGPKLWSFRRGETEYGLRMYPVGAFVRIIGMNNLDEVAPEDEARAYRNKSYPRRMLVITAGSIMHILIAIALVFTVYAVNGRRVETDRVGIGSVVSRLSGRCRPESKQATSSCRSTACSRQSPERLRQRDPQPRARRRRHAGARARRQTIDQGRRARVEPDYRAPASGKAFLGVASGNEVDVEQRVDRHSGRATASSISVRPCGRASRGVVKVLNPVNIVGHLTGANEDLNTRPTTVVGISKLSAQIGDESGFGGLLLTLAAVNVFVGLLNMFPVLPFDGGHAAIATYERLRSRRGRDAVSGRHHQDDPGGDDDDRGAGDAVHHRPLPRLRQADAAELAHFTPCRSRGRSLARSTSARCRSAAERRSRCSR